MTLQSSGILYMSQVHQEFGWGYQMANYAGRQWYRDDGSTGYFPTSWFGMDQFYGKRATSPAGVATADYVWGGKVVAAGSAIHLGADASNRYIAIMAQAYATTAANLDQCYLNGVSLPLLHYHEASVLDTDANNHYQKAAIFGGYYTGAVDVTAQFKLTGGATSGANAYVIRLTGSGLALRSTNQTAQGGAEKPITIPDKGIILGSFCQAKHVSPNWLNLDQVGIIHNGSDTIKLGWTSAGGWRYFAAGGTYNVRSASVGTFVGIG